MQFGDGSRFQIHELPQDEAPPGKDLAWKSLRLKKWSMPTGFALMLSAGQAVAEAAMNLVEEGPILVVAGRGNNGGDGFVAAAELAARGREVSVILFCERDSAQGDAASAARGWKYPEIGRAH